MDQMIEETVVTLYPDVQEGQDATDVLRILMRRFAATHDPPYWIHLVSNEFIRDGRAEMIRSIADACWPQYDEHTALWLAELMVMAAEGCAGRWEPEQCKVMVVRIDGTQRRSLVCNVEGFAS